MADVPASGLEGHLVHRTHAAEAKVSWKSCSAEQKSVQNSTPLCGLLHSSGGPTLAGRGGEDSVGSRANKGSSTLWIPILGLPNAWL